MKGDGSGCYSIGREKRERVLGEVFTSARIMRGCRKHRNGPNGVFGAPVQARTNLRRAREERLPWSWPSYHQMQTAMRVSAWSFSKMCCTCFCTVRELQPRILPISRLRFPAATHSTTSSSRFVKGRDSVEAGRLKRGLAGSPCGRPFREGMGVTFITL
jgi:hypothetical protein